MTLPAKIRVNTSLPFPSLVKGSGPLTVSKVNGVWTLGLPNVVLLNVPDQTITGGANVTSLTLPTGNVTIDCGLRPLQYITNGGAFNITAPSKDGSCILLITNNASAGTVTFVGFSTGSNTGDLIDAVNGHSFSVFIWRINGISGYRIAAHQ